VPLVRLQRHLSCLVNPCILRLSWVVLDPGRALAESWSLVFEHPPRPQARSLGAEKESVRWTSLPKVNREKAGLSTPVRKPGKPPDKFVVPQCTRVGQAILTSVVANQNHSPPS
jgi:hypothetical protein